MGFSDRLQKARIKKGYNQKELSLLMGRSENTVSNYENGHSKPNLDDLIKLLNLLEVDANYLLFDDLSETIKNKIANADLDLYNELNPQGKTKAKEYIQDLADNPKYTEKHSDAPQDTKSKTA